MSEIDLNSGHDPIRKSRLEANRFNIAWLKNGERLNWLQRVGFGIVSFACFSSGLLVLTLALSIVVHSELLSLDTLMASAGVIAGFSILVLGLMGLRNVLRF